jgi:hypothetical protein
MSPMLPRQESENSCHACIKLHISCAFLPRSAWTVQRAGEGRQPSPTTLVDWRSYSPETKTIEDCNRTAVCNIPGFSKI